MTDATSQWRVSLAKKLVRSLESQMRFLVLSIGFAVFVASLAGSLYAQQEEKWQPSIDDRSKEIIEKCIEAMGGEMALRAVETIELKGKSKTSMGSTSSFKLYLCRNKARKVTAHSGGNVSEWADNGEFFWHVVDGKESQATIYDTPIVPRGITPWPGTVLDWQTSKNKIRFVGLGEFEGKDVHTLAFERSDGALCLHHFSQKTGLVIGNELKLIFEKAEITNYTVFEYSTVEGIVLLSKKMTTQLGVHSTETEYEIVKIGGDIPDEYFEMNDTLKQRWKEIQQLDSK